MLKTFLAHLTGRLRFVVSFTIVVFCHTEPGLIEVSIYQNLGEVSQIMTNLRYLDYISYKMKGLNFAVSV